MKRMLSFLIAFAMVICLLPTSGAQTRATEVTEGDGTTANAPIFIETEEDWVYYLNNTTGYAYKHETQMTWHFRLVADIVLDAADQENGDTVNGAVGYTSTGKTTVIDMNGHTVTANGGTARFMAANSATSDLTIKNGSVVVNRATTSTLNGAIFFVNSGGRLTLDNMTVTETGVSQYTSNGELLYLGSQKSSATIKNTVMTANTTNNTKDTAVYVHTDGTSLDLQNSTINNTIHVTTTGVISVSGATKINKLKLATSSGVSAQLDVNDLSVGASICVDAAVNEAFTGNLGENAENYAAYFTGVTGKKVAVQDGALVVVADKDAGTQEAPLQIGSEAQWVSYLKSSTGKIATSDQTQWYITLTADITLDNTTDDTTDGAVSYSSTGKTIIIDFNGHTVTADGGSTRFISAASANSYLTMKNGTLIINRTNTTADGLVFNINKGNLILQDMTVREQSASAYNADGELLYLVDGTAAFTNTVMEANVDKSITANTVHIKDSVITMTDCQLDASVYVADATSEVTLSGAVKLTKLDLMNGAVVNAVDLSSGAKIGVVAALDTAFTTALPDGTAASVCAAYFTADTGLQIAVQEDHTLAVIAKSDGGDSSAENPIYINSKEDWNKYFAVNDGKVTTDTQQTWYFVLTADLVKGSADQRLNTKYAVPGKTVTIDFNGHKVRSANGTNNIFLTVTNGSLTLKNGTLEENGVSEDKYGAIFNLTDSVLNLENMVVDEYSATACTKYGDVIYATNSQINLINTTVKADSTGNANNFGAIYLRQGTGEGSVMTMVNSHLVTTHPGSASKGGWVTVANGCSLSMTDSTISGGNATKMGGNVYVDNNGSLTMTNSSITGGTADCGNDLYALGSITIDSDCTLGDGKAHNLYIGNKASFNIPSGFVVVDASQQSLWTHDDTQYDNSKYIKLYATNNTLNLTKDAVVDLNGRDAAITGTGSIQVTGFDSANSDYTTYGTATITGGAFANTGKYTVDGIDYYMVANDTGYSFHRLDMRITKVSLRTTTGGIYYWADWDCDSTLAAKIASYGIAVKLNNMPDAEALRASMVGNTSGVLYSMLTNSENGDAIFADSITNDEATGALINNILVKGDRGEFVTLTYDETLYTSENDYTGQIQIFGAPYVVFEDDTVVVEDEERSYSIYDVVCEICKLIDGLDATNSPLAATYTQYINNFFSDWKDYGLANWSRKNCHTAHGGDDDDLKILVIGGSLGYDTMYVMPAIAQNEGMTNVTFGLMYRSAGLDKLKPYTVSGKPEFAYFEYVTGEDQVWRQAHANGNFTKAEPHKSNDKEIEDGSMAISVEYVLQRMDWDIVIIMSSSSEITNVKGNLDMANADAMINYIIEHDADPSTIPQFAWHMIWALPEDSTLWNDSRSSFMKTHYTDAMAMYEDNVENTQQIVIPALEGKVKYFFPCATALQNAKSSTLVEDKDIHRDYIHGTDYGRLIAAYTWYCVLTGTNIRDCKFGPIPNGIVRDNVIRNSGEDYVLTEEWKQVLIESVENAIQNPYELTPSAY